MASTEQLALEPVASQLPVRQPTIMGLMQIALETGRVEQLQILQDMHFKQAARDAENDFNIAMNAVQAEITRVAPDAYNKQTQSKWATYPALDKMLRPLYVKNGFSLSFDSGESPAGTVTAFCYVSHCNGHTRRYQSPPVPLPVLGPQGKPVMTDTHGTGSAMSYAKRYLLAYIFNIPVGEEDTDGNGPQPEHGVMDEQEFKERLKHFDKCETLEELQDHWRNSYEEAKKAKDGSAKDAFIAAKDKRKAFLLAELKRAGK